MREKKIISIEPYGETQTYDLKVADNHNFFLSNGILTHNSGKDSFCGTMTCNDISNKRTVVVLDVKNEYSLAILCQQDQTLVNILVKNGLAGRGYKVNLWMPYVEGMDTKPHFQKLLNLHHPNIKIRPFRILKSDLVSEDTANMSLQKSAMQTSISKNMKTELKGPLAQQNEFKEEVGRIKLGLDDDNGWFEGCGWEYIDFDEMSKNGEINIITTYFLLGQNVVSTVAYMIAIMNELLTIGMRTHNLPNVNQVFSILVPELQIIMPRKVRSLENIVNTLQLSLLRGLLLMRSFGVRFRINLQNLSALHDDLLSQSRLFCGKTSNPKDVSKLSVLNVGKKFRQQLLYLSVGDFIDIFKRKKFNVVPFFHKSRQNEYLVNVLEDYALNPAGYLFETPNCLLSEIVDHEKLNLIFPCTTKEYNWRVKKWLKTQNPISTAMVQDPDKPNPVDLDDDINQCQEMINDFNRSLDKIEQAKSTFNRLAGKT